MGNDIQQSPLWAVSNGHFKQHWNSDFWPICAQITSRVPRALLGTHWTTGSTRLIQLHTTTMHCLCIFACLCGQLVPLLRAGKLHIQTHMRQLQAVRARAQGGWQTWTTHGDQHRRHACSTASGAKRLGITHQATP
jgi:hypothetical protein